MSNKRLMQALVLGGLALALAGGMLIREGLHGPAPAEGPARPLAATLVSDDKPLPPFRLESPRGPVTEQNLVGHWTYMFFGYTQCPDVCPSALALLADVEKRIAAQAGPERRPAVLFVSVDPRRDTMQLLGNFVPAFDPSFLGATGPDDQLAPLTKDLGVYYHRNDAKDTRHYSVDHTAAIYLIDPKARLRAIFSDSHDPAQVAADTLKITQP